MMLSNARKTPSVIFSDFHVLTAIVSICLLPGVMLIPYEDEVTYLPGLNTTLTWKQYSGYLNVTGLKRLHYWFVQSSSPTPEKDPLVLWLNGGPGCSSMVGLLLEHGPFKLEKDGQNLKLNPYAWNKVSNMLYLEAPAGVGYSSPEQARYDDDMTTMDNYEALKAFFKKFPELQKNSLFIAGESYGGFYVPTLSELVVKDKKMNFKGFAVGNAVLDWEWRTTSMMYFFYNHGIIGEKEWTSLLETCCKSQDIRRCQLKSSLFCENELSRLEDNIERDGINFYNIYDSCETPRADHRRDIHQLFRNYFDDSDDVSYPCVDTSYLDKYMNQNDVRSALHIPNDLGPWKTCRRSVFNRYEYEKYQNVSARFNNILNAKKRILVYSGDMDALVSYQSNQWFLDDLNLKETQPYTSWSIKDDKGKLQNAGYLRKYENIDFVTIKGAGHKAPMDKPAEALKMFKSFISNTPLTQDHFEDSSSLKTLSDNALDFINWLLGREAT